MFVKPSDVEIGQSNLLSGKDLKNLLKAIEQTFPLLAASPGEDNITSVENEPCSVLQEKLLLSSRSKVFKTRLPRKVLLYSLFIGDTLNNGFADNSAGSDNLKRLLETLKLFGYDPNLLDDKMLPLFFDANSRGDYFPTLVTLWFLASQEGKGLPFRHVLVHAPASKFILNGADVMLPGLIRHKQDVNNKCFGLGRFEKGEKVVVMAHGNPYPFAVGRFACSSDDIYHTGFNGKGIIVSHYFNDQLFLKLFKGMKPDARFQQKEIFANMTDNSESGTNHNADILFDIDAIESSIAEEKGEEMKVSSVLEAAKDLNHDELLEQTLCHAIKKVKSSDLPLLANLFYSNFVLPSRPLNTNIDIKKTKYKKFAAFLDRLQDLGILQLEGAKDTLKIVAVNPENSPKLLEGNDIETIIKWPQALTVGTESQQKLKEFASLHENKYHEIEVKDFYRPIKNLFPLCPSELNGLLGDKSTSDFFSASECRELFFNYLKTNNLNDPADGKLILLDPLLASILCRSQTSSNVTKLTKSDAWNKFLECFSYYHQIIGIDGLESKVSKGDVKKVEIDLKRRQGNKHITRVVNLEVFGIDPVKLAAKGQLVFSCSTTTQQTAGNKTNFLEVIIQGSKTREVARHLEQEYKLNAKYINISK